VEQWLDWPAFGFLALLTLLDGLRRVPAGALVLRKHLGGPWRVVVLEEGYHVVSWWPPLTTSVVIARTEAPGFPPEQLARRLEAVRKDDGILLVLGAVSLAALVLVVPIAIRWWGGMGFLAALMTVAVVAVLVTGLSYYAGGKLDLSRSERFRFALPRLNPFASPAAAEALLERALRGADPVAAARLLMKEEAFDGWIRPRAYDVFHGIETEGGEDLLRVLGHEHLASVVSGRPGSIPSETPWCPRCGSEFASGFTACSACQVPLNN
jgi:hypothetical protein